MLIIERSDIELLYNKYEIEREEFNIFGLRNTRDMNKDVFNDYIGYITPYDFNIYVGTTDPGVYYTLNKLNPNGCAHLSLGYQKNIWTIDLHNNKYEALCNRSINCNPTKVWRDANSNFKNDNNLGIEQEQKHEGYFGINLHRASKWGILNNIGKYSAGCQVIQDPEEYNNLIETAKQSLPEQKLFSYLLVELSEVMNPFFI